jgi:hypothetical protein
MQKTILFLSKKRKENSTKDGCQMVDVDLIPLESLHTYCNNIFALQIYTHSQFCIDFEHAYICNPSKHQITRVYTPKYNAKKLRT